MNKQNLAERIVGKMYDDDAFSQWLGIQRLLVEEGHCILKMIIRPEMVNGFGIAHGGIAFSFADSAFNISRIFSTQLLIISSFGSTELLLSPMADVLPWLASCVTVALIINSRTSIGIMNHSSKMR